jgi:hypothetical protein
MPSACTNHRKSLVCSSVLLGSSLEKYIMANKATQTVTAPVQSAVGSAVEMVAGRSLVEAQASLEEIFESTSNGEKMMARGESQVQQADALLLDWLTVGIGRRQASQNPYCPPRYRGQACHSKGGQAGHGLRADRIPRVLASPVVGDCEVLRLWCANYGCG